MLNKIKYLLLPVFLGVLAVNGIAQNQQNVNPDGYNKFYYENGILSSEGTMRNGKPDGYWKTYSRNGKIKSEGNRKNYMLDSLWKFYDEKGKLLTEMNYLNGKKEGIKRSWDGTGHVLLEEIFTADLKQGLTVNYYLSEDTTKTTGKIRSKFYFDKGKENGTAYEYDQDGNIITILEYAYGVLKKQEQINRVDKQGKQQGVWKKFYTDGKIKSEKNYLNGMKNGYEKEYSPTGSLVAINKYVGDSIQLDAPEISTKLEVRNEYYEDGSIKKTGTYLEGLPEGTHKEYSQDGKIKGKGNYVEGKKIEEWIFYYPNGAVEQKGKYDKKGKPQGQWQWYYDNNKSLREETYLNGKREGTMIERGDTGNVITKGEYVEGLKQGKWFYQIQDYREEGIYKDDLKDGPWESYYVDNSQVRFAGKFVDGLPDGKHTYYFHDGKKEEEGKYIMGSKDGDWVYFNPDGTPLITITFKNNHELKFDGTKVKPFLPGENIK